VFPLVNDAATSFIITCMPFQSTRHSLLHLVLVFLLCTNLVPTYAASDTPRGSWLRVDTDKQELLLMRGDKVVRRYDNIAIGRGGASSSRQLRDGATPLGRYYVIEITRETGFHVFIRLDYPSITDARQALKAGRIDNATYERFRRAAIDGRPSPQNTILGGNIGIGEGDPAIHEDFNWTRGCVALTNAQLDDLLPSVRIGTPVVIE
jgi:hypothetical protein